MRNRIILCVAVCWLAGTVRSAETSLLEINYSALVSRADLHYDTPARNGSDGLPVGNGHMGSLVWTSPTSLKLQVNRVDVFAGNAAANSFPRRHTDYCGGCAFVDVDFVSFGPDVFASAPAGQSLSCYDGTVSVSGSGVRAQIFAWHEQDVMAVYISDTRPRPDAISINLRMLRPPVVKTAEHAAVSEFETSKETIILTQKFMEADFFCASAAAVRISGRNVQVRPHDEQEFRLVAEPGNGSFLILISSAAGFNRDEHLAARAVQQLDAFSARGYSALLEDNKKWWHDFWAGSFVHLHSADGVADYIEQNYTYYLYVMASSSRGDYPAKFNGMIWTTGGDTRAWGSQFWGANQSCLYNALIPTGRWELMDPMFDMYTRMYESCELAARQQWGSQGLFIPETCAFDGLAPLPDDIAAEMRDLYLLRKSWGQVSDDFRDYASTKQPHASRWNWIGGGDWHDGKWIPTERPESPFGMVTHIFSRGAKIAYQYWQRYEYTLDETWLRQRAYPMLRGVADFYRHFPNLIKEADGKYCIHHVNSNESVRNARHTDEEVSSIMGVLPAAIRAAEILDIDKERRAAWQELLDNLAPLPVSNDRRTPYWTRALSPAAAGNATGRPDGNTMPQWFFDLCTLENAEKSVRQIAENTFNRYIDGGVKPEQHIGVLSKIGVTAAMMGRADVVQYLLPNQLKYPDRAPVLLNRMDQREGEQTTNVERLGRAADTLHNALLQSVGSGPAQPPVIRVFPAWPRQWDAVFTLMARGGFEVTASMQGGQTEFVQVRSLQGADCRIRNPWASSVTLWHNGHEVRKLGGDLLQFQTRKDQVYVLTKQGTVPGQYKRIIFKNEKGM